MGHIQIPVQGVDNNKIVTLTMKENGITKTITLVGDSYDDWPKAVAAFKTNHEASPK